jgi:hypothetical protein
MLKNLDAKERNWKKILEDNEKNAKIVLSAIMKDDEGGRRKIENSYRPPKPAKLAAVRVPTADRLKNLTSAGIKMSGTSKGKGGNKKGPIGKRKVGSSDIISGGLLNTTIDWMQYSGVAAGSSGGTLAAAVTHTTPLVAPPPLPDSLMGLGEDDFFNLDVFDDEGATPAPVAEPWQAPTTQVGDSSTATGWRSAIAEKESATSREKALKHQRENQQDVLRRARTDGIQSAAARREEEESSTRNALEKDRREKLEAQQLRDQARERERKAREEQEMTVDLDNNRDLLDE